MNKRRTLDQRLCRIQELGKQVEAMGFMIRACHPDVACSEATGDGLGSILEQLGSRIQSLSERVYEALANQGVDMNGVLAVRKEKDHG